MSDKMEMVLETDYMKIYVVEEKPKTKVFGVYNKNSGFLLGEISWYASWRQYCFLPSSSTVFNVQCLNDITHFINQEMGKR